MTFRLQLKMFFLSLLIVPASCVVSYASMPERAEGFLGEIRHSILSEDQFQSLYGAEWILMDGRPIMTSDLQKTFGWNEVPDARGVFLRGRNYERSRETGNAAGDLKIGGYQEDELESHKHKKHPKACQNVAMWPKYGNDIFAVAVGSGTSTDNAGHTAKTGGDETRPRNITVNIFIKINNTPDSRLERRFQAILDEIRDLPNYLLRNKAFMGVVDKVQDLKKQK